VRYGLRLPVVPSSNQSRGRGVLTKGIPQHVVAVYVVCDGRTEARPSVAPRARSNGWMESAVAQTDAVISCLHRLTVVGAQGALWQRSSG
jgi:hypothetical protein